MNLVYTIFPVVLVLVLSVASGDVTKDEDRPYEFQYNIEKHQHRQEKKDTSGIVTGEFGWVTADGIYRVTKYATDENGNFKIIGTSRTRVFPSPFGPQADGDLPAHKSRPGGARSLDKKPQEPQSLREPKKAHAFRGEPACSNCRLSDVQGGGDGKGADGALGNGANPGGVTGANLGGVTGPRGNAKSGANHGQGERHGKSRDGTRPLAGAKGSTGANQLPGGGLSRAGKQYGPDGQSTLNQRADGPLYRFNYTVGYHGHHELGQVNGDKEGGFFADHEDGVRRKVEYQANEFGYQPNLTLHDLAPQDVPSKDPSQHPGLKGYEFKWFGLGKE